MLSGRIVDKSTGEPLINAEIIIKETGKGTATNEKGFYSLSLPKGSYTIGFYYLGYQSISKKITISGDTKQNIAEGAVKPSQLQEKGYIVALNECPYAYRYDGYIPHFKASKIHIAKGEWTSGNADLSGPTAPAGCGPHTHDTTGTHQANNVEFTDATLEGIDIWNSTEVDLQNINNKIIRKGHRMYGSFVNGGEPGEFVVFAISNVTPKFDATEISPNADRPDTTIDGKTNPNNAEMP